MTEIKQPKIRFKGHINDWEQRKLGEVYTFKYGKYNNNPDNGGIYPIYGANGIIGGFTEYNSEDCSIIGHMGAYAGSVIWAEGKHFVTYNGTMAYPTNDETNKIFGHHMLDYLNIPKLTSGSGQPFVSYDDLNGIGVKIPKCVEEQSKIGEFFKTLNETIALHQRKLEVTKQFKQTMLKKMFPKNGETTPEIRFKGFTGDWEKFKVGKIFNDVISSGNRLPKDLLISGNTPYVIAQVENNGIFKYISKDTLDFSGKGMKLFNKNSITISIDNPEAIFVQKEDFYTSNIMRVLYNEKLTYEQHTIISEKIKEKTNGFGWGLKFSGPIIMNTEIFLPTDSSKEINFYELQMLGELFNNINSKIINLENKIIALNNLKGTMLLRMFI